MLFKIHGSEVEINQPHLKIWLMQVKLQKEIAEKAENHDPDELAGAIYKYLNLFSVQAWETFDWIEVLQVLAQIINLCVPKIDFPIFHTQEKNEQVPADYPEKDWYFWLHTMCSKYHWSIEYVSEMSVEDAFGLLQEGIIERQQKREWQWSLSELAYPFNADTKTSSFKPLPRPDWMQIAHDLTPKKTQIRKDMMPQGNIVDFGEMYAGVK
jgi:hypothetical protein